VSQFTLIDRAIGFAARAHEGQYRRAGNVPYIAHPVAVAMILQAMGCDETIIVAAILHDIVEDTPITLAEIRQTFGDPVADIVAIVTEPPRALRWEARKQHMIQAVRDAPLPAKLVAAADKYHNLLHTSRHENKLGTAVWRRFGRGVEQQAWYYREVTASILANVAEPDRYPIFSQLTSLVAELFAGVRARAPGE
jgi:(p)ppGpp synthase/HD superfamily hydrolase